MQKSLTGIADRGKYRRTNEDLFSIQKGLAISAEDTILAVGGSLDQGFAMLEAGAKRVFAVDPVPEQVRYMEQQVRYLENGDYVGFFRERVRGIDHIEKDCIEHLFWAEENILTNFFTLERLERIRRRLGSLEIKNSSIQLAAEQIRGWNKLYLSTLLGDLWKLEVESDQLIQRVSPHVPIGGLVYLAGPSWKEIQKEAEECGLVYDEELSGAAREDEMIPPWNPIVLRKQ